MTLKQQIPRTTKSAVSVLLFKPPVRCIRYLPGHLFCGHMTKAWWIEYMQGTNHQTTLKAFNVSHIQSQQLQLKLKVGLEQIITLFLKVEIAGEVCIWGTTRLKASCTVFLSCLFQAKKGWWIKELGDEMKRWVKFFCFVFPSLLGIKDILKLNVLC